MVIDINSISPTPPGKSQNNETGNAVPAPQATNSETSVPANPQDSVELSSTAQELNRLRQELQNLPVVDEARVEEIRQQISDGSYSIDPAEVASQIIDDDQNFLV